MKLTHTLSLVAIAFAGTLSSFAVTTAPASAAANNYYAAQLATPLTEAKTDIQRGVLWECEGDTCTAARKGSSRDMIVCQRLAGEMGDLTAFRAANKVFGEDDLAQCNK